MTYVSFECVCERESELFSKEIISVYACACAHSKAYVLAIKPSWHIKLDIVLKFQIMS